MNMREKFPSSNFIILWFIGAAIVMPVLGYIDRGAALFEDVPLIIFLYILVVLTVMWDRRTTHLVINGKKPSLTPDTTPSAKTPSISQRFDTSPEYLRQHCRLLARHSCSSMSAVRME
jgi:hypothetical protein